MLFRYELRRFRRGLPLLALLALLVQGRLTPKRRPLPVRQSGRARGPDT